MMRAESKHYLGLRLESKRGQQILSTHFLLRTLGVMTPHSQDRHHMWSWQMWSPALRQDGPHMHRAWGDTMFGLDSRDWRLGVDRHACMHVPTHAGNQSTTAVLGVLMVALLKTAKSTRPTPHPSAVMHCENLTTNLQSTKQPGNLTLLQTVS